MNPRSFFQLYFAIVAVAGILFPWVSTAVAKGNSSIGSVSVDYNPMFGKPNPVIHEAAERGDIKKLKAFLDSDPKVIEASDADGWTPLAHAARFGQVETVKFLLSRKANVNARDRQGYTPLHQAASYGLEDVVQVLLDAGATVNAMTVGRVTPRRLAASNGYAKVANLLKDNGGHL